MANKDKESSSDNTELTYEEKVDPEDLVLPMKQVQKVDEQLTIEFTDIKQEPIHHFEDHKIESKLEDVHTVKCIICDTYLTNAGEFKDFVSIHKVCFEKLNDGLTSATQKINAMEITINKISSDAKSLQNNLVDIKNEHKTLLSLNTHCI